MSFIAYLAEKNGSVNCSRHLTKTITQNIFLRQEHTHIINDPQLGIQVHNMVQVDIGF